MGNLLVWIVEISAVLDLENAKNLIFNCIALQLSGKLMGPILQVRIRYLAAGYWGNVEIILGARIPCRYFCGMDIQATAWQASRH